MFKRIIVFPLILLMLALTTSSLFASANKAIALTLKVTGEAMHRKSGADKATPLKFGTPLDDGDWISTSENGFAILIFADDKSQIKLRPNTEVVIKGKRDKDANISKRIEMEIGEVFTRVKQQRGALEIVTPTSVASVKGTEFWILVNEDGTTEVLTMEGLVELMNRVSGKSVNVGSGEKGTSDADGGNTVTPSDSDETPSEPEGDMKIPDIIEIDIRDKDGRNRSIIIQYIEDND
ncbi:MAG: FecR domain-containing protein [Calditrichaeota bacterium]|nr:FecR domain-containing protein [Calditrichota bacterium]